MKAFKFIVLLALLSGGLAAQVDSVYYGSKRPGQMAKTKEPKNDAWKENVVWGGNVQAWIGNPTFILVSPTIGYNIFKNFSMGVGGIYNYISYNSYYGNYSQSIFGGHSYARYVIGENYFVQLQYDKLRQPNLFSMEPNDKVWVDYVLVGGGFRQEIADNINLSTSVMFNVNNNLLSIYPSRVIIQFGITGTLK
ncbi:hypothetical protein CNR22_08215 [Sphingobacteriaceae bacterium]|nr:hypothetical protein CNR22_08215 [Sphingobacteriaceae bacterium]